MPKILSEFKTFAYENYEDYLSHAVEIVKEGWKFSNQRNDHKEVTWIKFYENE